jgi:hypothetical protein
VAQQPYGHHDGTGAAGSQTVISMMLLRMAAWTRSSSMMVVWTRSLSRMAARTGNMMRKRISRAAVWRQSRSHRPNRIEHRPTRAGRRLVWGRIGGSIMLGNPRMGGVGDLNSNQLDAVGLDR